MDTNFLNHAVIGIELGSTRIKAVLIDRDFNPVASGGHNWENQYENGVWTYSMQAVWDGIQDAYSNLAADVKDKFGVPLTKVGAIGVSAMMHGYLPFDKGGNLLTPFRTWRNTITGPASEALTEILGFNIPQRWSISHLYQAILNHENHVKDIALLTTLAGYVHWKLTGQKKVGIGEASGIFPIDSTTMDYNANMVAKFNALIADKGYPWDLESILPGVLMAGENAGSLTAEGAKLLDPSGVLQPGIPMAPPEGDAGTGMTATNAVAARTGNVSAGTSIFSMIVLEKGLSKVYPEIDMVTTPTGKPVAMVHCNNCTSDINAWADVFMEIAQLLGVEIPTGKLLDKLYEKSLAGDADCGGVMVCNYLSGEHITGFTEGRPLVVRTPESRFNLANFFRAQLYSAIASLKIGMDILSDENVVIDRLMGHGGLFKAPVVGQKYLAAAANSPVSVMETAGEGGPYGMALLASYMLNKKDNETLEDYLDNRVFASAKCSTVSPDQADRAGFDAFLASYKKGLAVERAAVENL